MDATKFSGSSEKGHEDIDDVFVDTQPPPVVGDEVSQSPPLTRVGKMSTRNSGKVTLPYKAPKKKRKVEEANVVVVARDATEIRLMTCTSGSTVCVGQGTVQLEAKTFHGKPIPSGHVVVLLLSVSKPKYPLPFPNMGDDPPQVFLKDAIDSLVLWPSDDCEPRSY